MPTHFPPLPLMLVPPPGAHSAPADLPPAIVGKKRRLKLQVVAAAGRVLPIIEGHVPHVIRARRDSSASDRSSVSSADSFEDAQRPFDPDEESSPISRSVSPLPLRAAPLVTGAAALVAAAAARLFPEKDDIIPNPVMGLPLIMPPAAAPAGSRDPSPVVEAVFSPIDRDDDSLPASPAANVYPGLGVAPLRLFPEEEDFFPDPAMGAPLIMPINAAAGSRSPSPVADAVPDPLRGDHDSLPAAPADHLDPDEFPDAQRDPFVEENTPTVVAEPDFTPPPKPPVHTRTDVMARRLEGVRGISSSERGVPSFNHERTLLTLQGVAYTVLTSEKSKATSFDSAAVVSIGANPFEREMLLMDATSSKSPKLEAAYQAFIETLPKDPKPTPLTVFKILAAYIHKEVFPKTFESTCEEFLAEWDKSHTAPEHHLVSADGKIKTPLIPIDDYIEAKFGVCRHQALVACYFISKLQKDGIIPEGEVLHIRETLPSDAGRIGHVWVWYNSPGKKELYHIDPMFNEAYDFQDADEYEKACKLYTKEILEKLSARFIGKA